MVSKGAVLAFDLGVPLAFYLGPIFTLWDTLSGAPAGSRGPMAVSKGIALALDPVTPALATGDHWLFIWGTS